MTNRNALHAIIEVLEEMNKVQTSIEMDEKVWVEFTRQTPKKAGVPPSPVTIPVAPVPEKSESAPAVPERPRPSDSWQTLETAVSNCKLCGLHARRTQTVFGEGSQTAGLMFIGEGPGEQEDRTGRPFVGAAGELLTKMIQAMKLSREKVYIANVVKCRPPGNRTPEPAEAACCIPYLEEQIARIKPRVIVLLGSTAVKYACDAPPAGGISSNLGKWLTVKGIPAMPIFHPSYLLRLAATPEREQAEKRRVWNALQEVMKKL